MTFSYYVHPDAEEFLKICFSLCESDKNEILFNILAETGGTWFMGGLYGGVCMWYQHFLNMTEEESWKRGMEVYSMFVYINTRWFDEIKKAQILD